MHPQTLHSRKIFLVEMLVVLLRNTDKARKLSDQHMLEAVMQAKSGMFSWWIVWFVLRLWAPCVGNV